MRKIAIFTLALAASLALFSHAALAADYGVIDVQQIFTNSKPGKAGAEHMAEVKKVLQDAMNEVLALHKDENTPESKKAIAEARQLLNRQLAIEQQAVNNILDKELRAACDDWLKAHKKIQLLISKQMALGSTGLIDFTSGVMELMNKRTAQFPALPKVTVNPKPAQAEDKSSEDKK